MNSFDSTYLVVTRVQHEEDMRRAAESRLVREARSRDVSLGLIWKFFGRLALTDEPSREVVVEPNPQTAA